MTFDTALAASRGLRRGDVDETLVEGVSWTMTAPPMNTTPAFTMAGGIDHLSVIDIRLAKLLGYWAKGETPPSRETKLMSLGVWRSKNEHSEIGGAPFYSIGEATTDLSHFQWLIPTSIKSSVKGFSYDIGSIMRFVETATPKQGDAPQQDFGAVIDAMERHGLSKFDGDFALDYAWAAKNGRTSLAIDSNLERLGRTDLTLDSGLPNFKALAGLAPKAGEPFDAARASSLFAESKLNSFSFRVVDAGMLTRIFAFAADMQADAAAAAGGPTGAMSADDLRAASAIALRTAGAASPFGALSEAFADFVAEGGALTITAKPKKPTPFVDLLKPGEAGETPVERLGLSATRTPS
jgi:hypothetical protein